MHLKSLCYALGITTQIVSVTTLPIAGPNGLGISTHLSTDERDGVSARSPEDIVPVEECKRALHVAPLFHEALYRRCAGEGEGEEESGAESDSDESSNGDTGGDENDDGDAENIQLASNSPRQDCILTQMGLFPMPNFGLCESLSDTPPTPNSAPPVTPVPAPVTPEPQPQPQPAPAPVHKPVPVDADGPARAIP